MNFKTEVTVIYFFVFLLSFQCKGQVAAALFEISKISDRVYVASQRKGVRVDASSTIIVGNTFITVVDAQSNVTSSKMLIDQIKNEISGKPIQYLVLTHGHIDNSVGATSFKNHNPQVSIIAHAWTRQKMGTLSASLKGHIDHVERLSQDLAASDFSADKDRVKKLAEFKKDLQSSTITLPDIVVSDSLIIYDKDLKIKIFHPGHGHTPGDLVVYISDEKLLVTGDLVHDFDPLFFGDADPEHWIDILNQLEALPFNYLVGARGTVQTGKEILRSFRNYLVELTALVKKEQNKGTAKADFLKTLEVNSFQSLIENDYGIRIQAMREKFQDSVWNRTLEATVHMNISQVWDHYARKFELNNKKP